MRISNLGPLERELQTEQWRQRSVARIASKLATTNAVGRTHHACLRHIHVSIYNVHLDVQKEGNISSYRSSSPPLSLRLCSNECCRGHAVWQVDNCLRHPPRTPQGQAWKHVFVIKADTERTRPSSLIPNHSLETFSAKYELSPSNAREGPSTKATPSEPLADAPRLGYRPRSLRRLGQPRRQEGSDSFSCMLTQKFVSNHHQPSSTRCALLSDETGRYQLRAHHHAFIPTSGSQPLLLRVKRAGAYKPHLKADVTFWYVS